MPLKSPRLKAGGPLNPLGIEPIGPPLPSPRPLKKSYNKRDLEHFFFLALKLDLFTR